MIITSPGLCRIVPESCRNCISFLVVFKVVSGCVFRDILCLVLRYIRVSMLIMGDTCIFDMKMVWSCFCFCPRSMGWTWMAGASVRTLSTAQIIRDFPGAF